MIASWLRFIAATDENAISPYLHLNLTVDAAQSLAWSVTDGMPLLIRQTTPQ